MLIPGPNNEMVTASLATPHDYLPNAASPTATFTPAVPGDWDTAPTTVAEALDEIAARLRAVEP